MTVWVPIARLLRAQGRHGEILADALGDLEGLFEEGREVWLANDEFGTKIASSSVKLEKSWWPTGRNAGRVVLKLDSCTSIETAETLRGKYLLIPEEDLPEPEAGEFFVRDLIGCTLVDLAGEDDGPGTAVGEIVGVEYMVATDGRTRLATVPDLLQVQLPGTEADAEPALIPFVEDWIEEVDPEARRVAMHLPQGLFEAQRPRDHRDEVLETGTD